MKKLIFNKIKKDTLFLFLTLSLSLGLIVWTLQAVNYLDFVTQDGHGLRTYFTFTILNFPKIIHRIIPFIFFVTLFYLLTNYEQKNELSIFWISGVSKIEFTNKIIFLSIMLTVFQIFLGSIFSPYSQFKARESLKNSNVDFFTSLIKEGKFINIAKNITIFIDKKNVDGSYNDIFIEDLRNNNSKMIYAKKGNLINDKLKKKFKLMNGRVIRNENTDISIFEFDEIDFSLTDLNSKTITVPKIQEIDTYTLLKCFRGNIKINENQIHFRCEKKLQPEIKRELFKRIFKPFFLPLITLICGFLIINAKNNIKFKKYNISVFTIAISLIIFSEISMRYIAVSNYLTILCLTLPVIFFFVSYFIFYKATKHV